MIMIMRVLTYLFPISLLVAALSGCKNVEYVRVPVETIRTDTAYVSNISRDSIYVRDSVILRESGDTVCITKWRYVYKDRIVRDTVFRQRVDSIPEIVPVERELTRWEKTKQEAGGVAIGVLAAAVVACAVWLMIKIRKRI